MHLGETLFFIPILVSKLLYCINFLLFMQTFFNYGNETFLIPLTLLVVQDLNFYGLTIILKLIKILLTLKNFRDTILTLSISYSPLRENLKTGITSRENFNSPIIYLYYKFTQISYAVPKKLKQTLRENRLRTCVIYLDHHVIKIIYFLVWKS